jgi:hypothetical protein
MPRRATPPVDGDPAVAVLQAQPAKRDAGHARAQAAKLRVGHVRHADQEVRSDGQIEEGLNQCLRHRADRRPLRIGVEKDLEALEHEQEAHAELLVQPAEHVAQRAGRRGPAPPRHRQRTIERSTQLAQRLLGVPAIEADDDFGVAVRHRPDAALAAILARRTRQRLAATVLGTAPQQWQQGPHPRVPARVRLRTEQQRDARAAQQLCEDTRTRVTFRRCPRVAYRLT